MVTLRSTQILQQVFPLSLKGVGTIMMCTELCWQAEIMLKLMGRESPLVSKAESLLGKTRIIPPCQGSLVTLLTETEVIPFYLEIVQGGNANLLKCL